MRYLATLDPECSVLLYIGGKAPYRDVDMSVTDSLTNEKNVVLFPADGWTPDGMQKTEKPR